MSTLAAASRYFLPCFVISQPPWCKRACALPPSESLLDHDPHVAGGAFDLAHGALQIHRVEILHLDLGDLTHLRPRDFAHLLPLGFRRAFLYPGRLLQQYGRRRGLQGEREAGVREDGDLRRHDFAGLPGGPGVVLLAELHQVDPMRCQRRPNRRRRAGLAGLEQQLVNDLYLFLYPNTPSIRPSRPVESPAPPASPGRRTRPSPALWPCPCRYCLPCR